MLRVERSTSESDDVIMEFVLFLVIAGLIALIPANIAKNKGHSFAAWYTFGFLMWIIALPASLMIKSKLPVNTNNSSGNSSYTNNASSYSSSNLDVDRLQKLKEMKDKGLITQEEFDEQKSKILNS